MNRLDPSLRMALAALPVVAVAVSFGLGLPFVQWFVVAATAGGVLCAAVLYGVCRAAVSRKARAARAVGVPWLLAILSVGLPEQYALAWAEEMHAQLHHAGRGRPGVLWNVATRVPGAWLGDWRAHWQHSRQRRYRGDNLLLVARLDLALRAPSVADRLPGRFAALHAVGMSRVLACRPVQHVHALALAQQLLSTHTADLTSARDHVRELLAAREEAHVITRALRRRPGPGGLPDRVVSHQRLATLRDAAHRLVDELRVDLRAFVDGERNPDGERG
jgi:hypothetical protein